MSNSLQKHNNGKNGNGRNDFEHLPTFTVSDRESNDSDALNPKKILGLLLRYKWLVLLFLLAGGTAAWFYADTITPVYESKGTLLINTSATGDDELSRIISQTTGVGTNSTLANELQILQSREFARQIANRIIEANPGNITEFPVLWNEDEEGNVSRASEEAVTSRIRSNLKSARLERDSEVIELSFQSPSQRETAYIVNEAMDVYVDNSTLQNRRAAESTAEFLESEKEEIRQKLEASEQRLRNYMDQTGIVQMDQQASGMVTQMAEVESELQRINLELETIEQALVNHEQQMDRIRPGLSEQFSEAIGPRIRNSQEQLAQYETERTMILTRNPGVRDRAQTPPRLQYLDDQIERLKAEITGLSDQLFTEDDEYLGMDSEERAQMVATIQTRLVELRIQKNQYESRRQALNQRKQELDRDFNSLPEGMIELARLQRDVQINEELFVNVSRQYADMSVLKQSQFGFGRIVDTARTPVAPVSPNKKILLILGIMLGGMFAAGIIFVKEFMDNSINSVDMLKSSHLPLLSAVPVLDRVSKRNRKTFNHNANTIPDELVLLRDRANVASESIRRLKNNIIYQYGDTPPKTMAVTSAEKGDGKSTIVANLGIAFAEEGFKTLVIDTDFRRPKLHEYYGLSNNTGLSNYLFGDLVLKELIQDSDLGNLKIITAGNEIHRPENIVNSNEFKLFLGRMKEVFEVIILDTPPFGIISDSTALLKRAEATLLVTKYRKTNRGVFLKTIEELERINANVSGIVLNSFDHRKEIGSNYGRDYYQALYSNYDAYVN
jgi:capsular exopolysaccharide synthesis family protein